MLWDRLPWLLPVMVCLGCSVIYTRSPRYHRPREKTARSREGIPIPHPMERNKGRLPWPVPGEVVSNFGIQVDPKYGTKTKSSGIDIACREGSPVMAVEKGVVSYADQFMGQGLLVIVEHGGGFYSVYGRLGELKVKGGQRVAMGDTIGLSGTVLHFELRIGGKAVDPREWLLKK